MQRDVVDEKPPTRHQQLQDLAFKLLEGTSLESYLATHARKLPSGQKPEVVILDEKATIASTLKVSRCAFFLGLSLLQQLAANHHDAAGLKDVVRSSTMASPRQAAVNGLRGQRLCQGQPSFSVGAS